MASPVHPHLGLNYPLRGCAGYCFSLCNRAYNLGSLRLPSASCYAFINKWTLLILLTECL